MEGGVFVDGGWYGWMDGGLRRRGAGGDRSGPLAAIAAVGELMIMEAAGQLGLFQMSGDVLVGHFLETGLEKVDFL